MNKPEAIVEVKGECHGVRLEERGENDPHVCVQILVEDDENWFESGNSFSSFWLDEMIAQLQRAKAILENDTATFEKDKDGYGWQFKEK